MYLNRRIETLEMQSPLVEKVYSIRPKLGETPAEAKQRYCQENNVTETDLDAGLVIRRIIVFAGRHLRYANGDSSAVGKRRIGKQAETVKELIEEIRIQPCLEPKY